MEELHNMEGEKSITALIRLIMEGRSVGLHREGCPGLSRNVKWALLSLKERDAREEGEWGGM